MKKEERHIQTKLIHSGEAHPLINGAVSMPIFQSATFQYGGQEDYHDLKYIRLNNTPNHIALHEKLAALENSEAALVTSSGMAAISSVLLTLLSEKDHFLAQTGLYGGTHELIANDLTKLGISVDFIDGETPGEWERQIKPETRAIYIETIGNPLMQIPDLEAAAAFAQRHGIISIVDNTFATPINFRPAEWGFDLSLHSCTKYLNGHSDIVAGAVIGKKNLVDAITRKLNHLGGSLDPHACFLLHRGIKTLAVRMKQHNESGLEIARFLEHHPAVRKVNYPGLESHPQHDRALKLFEGFSGMISFELEGDLNAAERFLQKLTLPIIAPSLGGVESLITRPATTSHVGMDPEERMRMGISDNLIRLSVGIESTQDLIRDIEQGLK
jgi:cystathionine beta-lyase/cystathionine gamma-synthase